MLFIIWKERNSRIFNHKVDLPHSLTEKVKLLPIWWLKSHYVLFDFDYLTWRSSPLSRLKADV